MENQIPLTSADVDRLLGLADQLLDDWAEDLVQLGKPDAEYEERLAEWTRLRPLLVSAPELLGGLKQIAGICHGSSEPMAIRCGVIARAALDTLTVRAIAIAA